jgi:hypothetical protein
MRTRMLCIPPFIFFVDDRIFEERISEYCLTFWLSIFE